MVDRHTFIELLKAEIPFSFVKFGDGEFYCMMKCEGGNCDNHPYTPELGDLLIEAYKFLCPRPDVYVGFWTLKGHEYSDQLRQQHENQYQVHSQYAVYMTLLLSPENTDITEFYKTIKQDTRRKVFVGPLRLQPAASMLQAEYVEFPLINGFTKFASIRDFLLSTLTSNTIYMFCAGMNSEPLITSLLKQNSTLTCLDLGSAMDPLFVDQPTRWDSMKQVSHQTALDWFHDLFS